MKGMHCRPRPRGSLKGQRPGGRDAALSQGRRRRRGSRKPTRQRARPAPPPRVRSPRGRS
eukprot:8511903-Lingulodinium_polyedra.AAC.1